MPFKALPLLDTMYEFYETTPIEERFKKYLYLLQGNTKDIILPISGYNPMAKKHVNEKIKTLVQLQAENILKDRVNALNIHKSNNIDQTISVAINVCDDIGGAWSQIYTTDYTSKFHQASLFKRNFCVPLFYVSQAISKKNIEVKLEEYMFRSIYFETYGQVFTLEDHVKQEIFVAENITSQSKIIKPKTNILEIDKFYKLNFHETDHSIIFNFFYGDTVSKNLGYKLHGINDVNGFDYIRHIVDSHIY